MNKLNVKEKIASIFSIVLLVVVTIILVMVANHQRSEMMRENDTKTTEVTTIIATTTEQAEEDIETYLQKKEEAHKQSLIQFKKELKAKIEQEEYFNSPEAERFLTRYLEAPIDDKRDNFFVSEEERNALDSYCESTRFDFGEVCLTQHIVLSIDASRMNVQITIYDDDFNIDDYRLLSWD